MRTSYIVTTSYCGGQLAKTQQFETLEQVKEFENWYKNELNEHEKFFSAVKISKRLFNTNNETVIEWAE